MTIKVLSGGAAQGLIHALEDTFRADGGCEIDGSFGAVGGMKERILNGEDVDLIVLTRAIISELDQRGEIAAGTIRDVGQVETGVAVPTGNPKPEIGNASALSHSICSAEEVFFPDPNLATAGIHFAKLLAKLDISELMSNRLRPHPNGATAMAAMASTHNASPIGCTQITEILSTPGVDLVGPLPQGFELSTVYTAAVSARAQNSPAARQLAALLTNQATLAARTRAGFNDA